MLKRICEWILRQRYPVVLVGLGLLMALPSLWGGLFSDDFSIRAAVLRSEPAEGVPGHPWEPFTLLDGDAEHSRRLVERGLLPWWAGRETLIAFMRPLTAATHMLDYHVWPRYPVLMHLQSLAWFGLLIWVVAIFYRRFLGRAMPVWVAVLAALMFTVDEAHAVPVAWLANRNTLLAGVFGVLTLNTFDRWRRDGWLPGAWLAPLALAAGLLAKEMTVSVGAYLLAYALFLDRGRTTGRVLSLLPSLAVGVVWYAVYKGLGFGVSSSEYYADPAANPAGFAVHVLHNAPLLLLGQWGLPNSIFANISSTAVQHAHWLWAVCFLILLGIVLVPLIARDVLARFWTLGMLLSLLPGCIPPPADRLLMFVGFGGMGLLAQWLGGLREGAPWLPRSLAWRRFAQVFAWLLVGIHLVVAPLLFVVMAAAPTRVTRVTQWLLDTFPKRPRLESQTAVVAGAAVWGASRELILTRHHDGQPLPARILHLHSITSPASITRLDAHTLAVRPAAGYLPRSGWSPPDEPPRLVSRIYGIQRVDRLFISERRPFELHDTIELTAATIEITDLTDDGRPAEATFRFRVPLEDPSLCWLQMTGKGYAPLEPPAIGQTIEVPTLW